MNRASSQLVNCLFKIPEFTIQTEQTPEVTRSGMRVQDVKVAHATR